MSISRKSLIQNKYTEFYELLKSNNFNEELCLFPDLDSVDITDLTYLLTMIFLGINDEDSFHSKIIELAEINGVELSLEKLKFVTPLFMKFMIWLRSL